MDDENFPITDQKIETTFIKTEVLDPVDNLHFYNEEPSQSYDRDEIKIEESGILKYECADCEAIFSDKFNLNYHTNKYHNEDSAKYVVKEHSNFGNIKKSTEHFSEKPFKCSESGCTKSFKTKRDVIDHMKVHSDEKPYICIYKGCGKSYKAGNNLKKHMRLHSDDTPFKCTSEGCHRAFKRKFSLETHQRIHSLDSKSVELFVCNFPECNTTFRWKHSYQRHMKNHELGRRYRCTIGECTAAYLNSDNLKDHIRVHMGERFFCTYEDCNVSYSRKDKLNIHLKKHQTSNESTSLDERFFCTYKDCDRSYSRKDKLKFHLRKHQMLEGTTNQKVLPSKVELE